jgi:hypothetical protein
LWPDDLFDPSYRVYQGFNSQAMCNADNRLALKVLLPGESECGYIPLSGVLYVFREFWSPKFLKYWVLIALYRFEAWEGVDHVIPAAFQKLSEL